MNKRILIPIIALVLASCGGNKEQQSTENNAVQNNRVITAEEQAQLTPDKVIEILKQGNEEFINNKLTVRNNTERVKDAANGQYPQAVILSCLDSRVPVEDVFNCAIGDVFVARVAGNIVNPDILGSMEFACKVSGAKAVLVLGHESCGAIKSAIDNVELGNITELLSKIKPAVNFSKTNFEGDATSANSTFVELVSHNNVELTMEEIRKNSPILKEMEEKGEIKIIGAMYDLHTGKVNFFENK
jgi:carbonic anhydrase